MAKFETVVRDEGVRWQIELLLDGMAVSGTGIVKKQMQIGSAVVRQGGIAGVWTDEAHRKKGYASRVMWEAVSWMAAQKYDMSILFGIADFYHRYGYAAAFAEQAMTIETKQLQTLQAVYRTRKMKASDLASIKRVYRQYHAGRCGMDARRKDWVPMWRMPRMGEGTTRRAGQVMVVSDGKDRLKGFVVFDTQAGRLVVSEVCGIDRSALVTLGFAIGRRAKREGAEQVRFCLPLDDPFLDVCVPLGYSCSASYPFTGGAMGRIISLEPLFQKMTGVFSDRVKASGLDWTGEVVLKTDIGTVGLHIGRKSVSLKYKPGRPQVYISQMALSQLVMGYRAVDDVAHDLGVSVPQRLLPVLNVLFPKGNPYMWWTDRF
jgi:predicted acetyltransferase